MEITTIAPDQVIQRLKTRGMRVTPQRFAVYANLLGRVDHPTVEMLFHDLNQDGPTSSQATIYSTLQALQGAGLVREVLLESGVSRYDANVQPHHHCCCRGCGAIRDLPWESFPGLNLDRLPLGFRGEGYEVTVWGRCEVCDRPVQ